jgi:hypothetical protein
VTAKIPVEELEELLNHCKTSRQREYVQALIDHGSVRAAASAKGVMPNAVWDSLKIVRLRRDRGDYIPQNQSRVDDPRLDTSIKADRVRQGKIGSSTARYLVTSAQNATPVNQSFYKSLLNYCKRNNSTLIIIPIRYRNPTSTWSEEIQSQEWWAPELMPDLLDHRMSLCEHLKVLGDVRIQPTAVRPTSGMETFAGGESVIIGHPKLEWVTVPAPQYALPKILVTTGSVTVQNYSDSKAGKKGEHHHTFGAVVVEVDGDNFYLRHVNADKTGGFYDLDRYYGPTTSSKVKHISGLVLGDLHERFVDPSVVDATFDDSDSIVNNLKPEHVVYHDVMDFYSRNHHHRRKVFTNIAKHRTGHASVEDEVNDCADFISNRIKPYQKIVFVPSNHPDALAKWVEETDWRDDPENAEFYLKTALIMAQSTKMTDSGAWHVDPFNYWMREKIKKVDQCIFPSRDESYLVSGIEVTFHGDRGANGSRGSIKNFGRIGVKSVIGHSHTPGVIDGAYQVGTSSRLRLEYNSGPSSWMHCHCLIYPNQKRTLITIINGKWRL